MDASCRSYRDGPVCKDGFPITPFCHGSVTCEQCGAPKADKYLPLCLKEIAPKHLFDDAGLPLLADHRRQAGA